MTKLYPYKFKRQSGFHLFELIVILAAIAIIAAVAVPRFFDFNDRANEKLWDTAISELNGEAKLVFAEIKNSPDG